MNNLNYWNQYKIDRSEFTDWVEISLLDFRKSLKSIKFTDDESLIKLKKAISYAIFNEGKRIRPLLCIAAGEIVGTRSNINMLVAAAIEMVHVYSLCQDDMPCMDNDTYRHGKLSLHEKYSVSTASLVCDALLAEAFYILSTLPFSDTRKVKMIQELSRTIGAEGMTAGQFLDLESNYFKSSVKHIERISYLKTTTLIQASLKMGVLCSNHIEDNDLDKYFNILERYGYLFGQAYQIIDDVLDCCDDKNIIGKTPGKDLRDNKATSVSCIGKKKSIDKALNFLDDSIKQVQLLEKDSLGLMGLSLSMIDKLLKLGGSYD
ncbi:polyprenyl synthetase family protein [Serratia fonticola]|uniref:polyprenyl synthetase family protein n=1 Tax=Serratia fonticola TaxID=47917 RepID=UPI003AFFD425